MTDRACPCLHTTPCKPGCTCVQPVSSAGCLRCCTYGSSEQQRKMAEHLAKVIDEYHSRIGGTSEPHRIFWTDVVQVRVWLNVNKLEQSLRETQGALFEDPWSIGFTLREIDLGTYEHAVYDQKGADKPEVSVVQKHAGRIRYLLTHPEELATPIKVGLKDGQPWIEDGWHRFFASIHRSRESIQAEVSRTTLAGLGDVR